MDSWTRLKDRQRRVLDAIITGADLKRSVVAAWVAQASGEPCDDSTISRWRAGDRAAPLGLVGVLDVLDDQEFAGALRALAVEYGRTRVHVDVSTGTVPAEAVERLRAALSLRVAELGFQAVEHRLDGVVTLAELQAEHRGLDELIAQAAQARDAIGGEIERMQRPAGPRRLP